MRILYETFLKLNLVSWQRLLEESHTMKSFFNKVILIVTDGLRKEHCIAAHLVCQQVIRMYRRSGALHTALYLKQSASCLMRWYGEGGKVQPYHLPVPVSLTRTGLPRMIPAFHRNQIRKFDDKADTDVQLYLSFFSLSKVIIKAKTKMTFASPEDIDRIISFIGEVKGPMKELLLRYVPTLPTIPLKQGIRWDPSWKALPTHKLVERS